MWLYSIRFLINDFLGFEDVFMAAYVQDESRVKRKTK